MGDNFNKLLEGIEGHIQGQYKYLKTNTPWITRKIQVSIHSAKDRLQINGEIKGIDAVDGYTIAYSSDGMVVTYPINARLHNSTTNQDYKLNVEKMLVESVKVE